MKKLLPLSIVSLIVWSSCCSASHYSSGSHSNSSLGLTRAEERCMRTASSSDRPAVALPALTAVDMPQETAVSADLLAAALTPEAPTDRAISSALVVVRRTPPSIAVLTALAQADPNMAGFFAAQHGIFLSRRPAATPEELEAAHNMVRRRRGILAAPLTPGASAPAALEADADALRRRNTTASQAPTNLRSYDNEVDNVQDSSSEDAPVIVGSEDALLQLFTLLGNVFSSGLDELFGCFRQP